MKVVPLHSKHNADDLVNGLRRLADDIEAGTTDHSQPPNLAVVVLGYETVRRDRDSMTCSYGYTTHGFGEKCTVLTARGLLASAIHQVEDDG